MAKPAKKPVVGNPIRRADVSDAPVSASQEVGFMSQEEIELIQLLERSMGRQLTPQEISLALDQARYLEELSVPLP